MTEQKTTGNRRLINVSNRLPVKLTKESGKFKFQTSEGGVATGLNSVMGTYPGLWIGWPGAVVEGSEKAYVQEYLTERSYHPIFLNEEEIAGFYEGFSNETLWPLLHYFPTYSDYNQSHWETYVEVNRKFADAVIAEAQPDDVIWVHDYQLMLVPEMVREAFPEIRIGYFHHIPFPEFGIFRSLPWKAELLKGIMGADIVGFQTKEDAAHFRDTAEKILETPCIGDSFLSDNREVSVQIFPIGIDYAKFTSLAEHELTESNVQKIKSTIHTKIALSVDRLDYSKGILQRLRAYEMFLSKYKEWHQKITLVHIIVPSRDNVRNYKELKVEMDRLISSINGKFATLGWQPIQHFYRSFDPYMLSAFYKCADMAIVTPLRDGMNLVSKEYIASNINKNGVLLLGEAAGAANELQEAILLNPNDVNDFATKIYEGLNITGEEKRVRMHKMQQVISQSDIFKWANSFIRKLLLSAGKKRKSEGKLSDELSIQIAS